MARPRTPKDKAELSGAAVVHPARFKERSSPKSKRPLGEPYAKMNAAQKEAWEELRYEMPWLTSSDRVMVRLACMWIAKMDNEDFGVSATQGLSSILSKLGASPSDVSKVNHDTGEEEDPSDKFFNRPH